MSGASARLRRYGDANLSLHKFLDVKCADDDARRVVSLRPRQRLADSARGIGALGVSEGILAVEISLAGGKRQILDFLMPGDVADSSPSPGLGVALRAITLSRLELLSRTAKKDAADGADSCQMLREQLQAQLARSRLYQIMVGHLDTEARLAAFLYGLALRSSGKVGANLMLSLPMSRDDVADHLAINHDTISRVMMRFETEGFIQRVNRHAVHITDIDKLRKRSTIGGMLLSVLVRSRAQTAPA